MKFLGVEPGNGSGAVDLVYGASATGIRANVGQLAWETGVDPQVSPGGDDIITFCIELSQYVSGATKQYEKAAVDDAPLPGIAGYVDYSIGPTRAAALDLLADNFWGVATGSSLLDAVAFQLAVWEIVHETPTGSFADPALATSLDISQGEGAFYVANPTSKLIVGAVDKANDWLTSLSNGGLEAGANDGLSLLALTNPTKQDQIIQYPTPQVPPPDPQGGVPEPVSLLVWAGLYGICLGTSRRRK